MAESNWLPAIRLSSLAEQEHVGCGAEYAADYGPDHGDPGVPPVVAALAGYGQDRVCYAWPEVAGRVDGVAGRTSEREPDAEHYQADKQGVDAASYDRRRTAPDRSRVRSDTRDTEDEHEGADDLGDDVRGCVVDRWRGAENAELEALIRGLSPVGQVGKPHDDSADERAEELRDYVGNHVR